MMMMMMMIKFLLATLLVISPKWICGDKEMMVRQCRNVHVPVICMQCLESDPTSLRADPVGIAVILIHCLDSHLHILINELTKSPKVKVMQDCKNDMLETITKLPDAKNCLKNGDFDKAGHLIRAALVFPLRCGDNLRRENYKFDQLYTQINIYGELSLAVMRIVDRF